MKFSDIVHDYETYKKLQKGKYCSLESTVKKWQAGQRRYINKSFKKVGKSLRIVDIACGDGVGLREFKKLHYTNVTGIELNQKKAKLAKKVGYPVLLYDMHNLSKLQKEYYDIVYSSHTIEHAYYPSRALREFWNILKPNGRLFVVLPYPDPGHWNDQAHGAKYELGTNIDDDGRTVVRYFENHGFNVYSKKFDFYREKEIWLYCRKKTSIFDRLRKLLHK